MSLSDELLSMSSVEMRRRIGTKEVSPVELVAASIARIEALNPAVNAIAATDFARAEARDKRGISRPQGRATWPTARLADRHQGPPRDRRAADDLRLAALSQPRARTRRGYGRAYTQGGRDLSLQDQRAGIWSRREYAQPRVGRDRKSL